MTAPAFLFDRSGPVLTVTFNRADRLNAFRRVEYQGLHRLLGELAAERGLRVVVLTGAGRGFCAGEDLKELQVGEGADPALMRADAELLQDITRRIVDSPAVFIAAVNGVAAGFGAELAVACDLRLGGADARFLFPEVRRGLFVTNGVSLLLPRIVGATWAAHLLLTGQPVDATTAARIGLLTEVVPDGVAARAADVAAALAGHAPTAMRETKRILRSGDRALLEQHLHDEVASLLRCLGTGEPLEGARAFLEKRPPHWTT